ncbi:Large neutral amino acids transporter small subunit 1 [Strongyloides ratti]|uniref:Large neutral amino acids transporter small subunit 1 n=1 Tax=Strongyloides ratti TaxID=34506 RepID=A0A090MZ86_STRRB|nr:Large neutral amino acids transporter small subunit 1 [Strongyloides ratti]CEF68499.1 Large neutral amino acids transporter small subunit 1 [Strongyloides ratti]
MADKPLSKTSNNAIKMKPRVGLSSGVAIIIGIIVGSGIFVSPKGVLVDSGSVGLSLLIWLLCGGYATLGALCYVELGTTIPKSGGDYIYIYESFGETLAFLFLWINLIIVIPTSNAVMALTFSNYILKPLFPYCDVPENAIKLLAVVATLLLTFINCYNVKYATKTQNVFTVGKVLALLMIICSGVVYLLLGNYENFEFPSIFEGSKTDAPHIALAFYSGVFSFSGFNYLNFMTEELKEPIKNLPRAIFLSMPLVTIIYFLVNISYFAVLTPDELLDSNAVAVTFASRIMGPVQHIIPLFVAISCIGGLNGIILTSSRMFFVGARNGQLPELLSMVNIKYLTPMPALIILGLFSAGMCMTSDIYALINYVSFAETSVVYIAIAGLVKLRICKPDLERPIKYNILIPIIFLIICTLILVLPFFLQPKELLIGLAIILSGLPVYYIFVAWKKKPNFIIKPWIYCTQLIQKVLYCIPEEEDHIE